VDVAPGDARRPVRTVVDVDPMSIVLLAVMAALAAAAWSIASIAPDVLTGIAVGLVLGLALSPVVTATQRRMGRSRTAAVAVVGFVLVVIVAAVVFLVAPAAVDQAADFGDELPSTVEDLYSWPVVGPRLEEADAAREVEQTIEDLPARVDDDTLADLGQRLIGGALSTVLVLITALGLLVDGELLVRRVRAAIPPARQPRAREIGNIVYRAFGSYFAGSLLVAVLNGLVVLTTGLLLGVPLAPVAALWSMLTNFIPQIGGFLGGSFLVLLALTESPTAAVIAGTVFLLYQQLENNVISPAVVGRAVNLSPPSTMLAVLVGGAAGGVPGALVATPLLGAAKAVYLERRGMLPPPEETALGGSIRARLGRLRSRLQRLRR